MKLNNLFGIIKEEHKTTRNFSYSKDKVGLNFALRVDVKNELRAFQELLIKALKDVEEELLRFK